MSVDFTDCKVGCNCRNCLYYYYEEVNWVLCSGSHTAEIKTLASDILIWSLYKREL